ncbi:1924_t:CDS:2, partial [Gigaspora rosea]
MSSQRATPPRQNYLHRSITPPRHSCQINRNYRNNESRSCRSISPNERYHSRHRSRSPDEKDK